MARTKSTTKKEKKSAAAGAATPVAVAEAVLDLCDLAMRVLTADQRGQTSLAENDKALLETVVADLEHVGSLLGGEPGARGEILLDV